MSENSDVFDWSKSEKPIRDLFTELNCGGDEVISVS